MLPGGKKPSFCSDFASIGLWMTSLPGNNDVVALWILEFLRLGEGFLNVLPSVSFSGGS